MKTINYTLGKCQEVLQLEPSTAFQHSLTFPGEHRNNVNIIVLGLNFVIQPRVLI